MRFIFIESIISLFVVQTFIHAWEKDFFPFLLMSLLALHRIYLLLHYVIT